MAESLSRQSALPAKVRHLVIVLGDQLDLQSSALEGFDATQDVVWMAEVVEEFRAKGIDKPVVASLVGDVQVEEACQYLYERGIVAYPYTTETPVEVLGAKYKWARSAGLLGK